MSPITNTGAEVNDAMEARSAATSEGLRSAMPVLPKQFFMAYAEPPQNVQLLVQPFTVRLAGTQESSEETVRPDSSRYVRFGTADTSPSPASACIRRSSGSSPESPLI